MPLIGGRGGGNVGSSVSTRVTTSANPSSTNHGVSCDDSELRIFAPLNSCQQAQDWCKYYWPQPLATATCTVDKEHPSPTTIQPAKASKPTDVCDDHSNLCNLYESFKAAENQNLGAIRNFASDVCSCIGAKQTMTIIVPGSTTHASSTKTTSTQLSSSTSKQPTTLSVPASSRSTASSIGSSTSARPITSASSSSPFPSSSLSSMVPSSITATITPSPSLEPSPTITPSITPATTSAASSTPSPVVCTSSDFQNAFLQVENAIPAVNGQYITVSEYAPGEYGADFTPNIQDAAQISLNAGTLTYLVPDGDNDHVEFGFYGSDSEPTCANVAGQLSCSAGLQYLYTCADMPYPYLGGPNLPPNEGCEALSLQVVGYTGDGCTNMPITTPSS